MSTFDEAVEIATRKNAATTDKDLPDLGSLDLKAMTSETALAGTNGITVSLIHGNEWNQLEGNRTENILKSLFTHITINEVRTVDENLANKVTGTTNDTRVGVHNQTNIAPRNDTFMHTRTEIHHQPEHREQKTEDFNVLNVVREVAKEIFEFQYLKMEARLMHLEFCATVNFEKKLFDVTGNIFKMEGDAIEVKMSEIKASLGALGTEIKGGKLKAAATHLKAIAGNINAGIALNADSPFG